MRKPLRVTLLLVAAAGIGAAAVHFATVVRGDLPPAEARRLVEAGGVLVDVRTREEFAGGHVAGAINLPVQELGARMGELPRDKALVLYCRSGHRAGRAARMLKEAGYGDVHNLGAMSRWPDVAAMPRP